jgi:hypothetical protein
MKHVSVKFAAIVGCVCLMSLASPAWSQGATPHTHAQSVRQSSNPAAGPANVKVEFENRSVVVLRIRLRPHEKTPMHPVTPRVVVWLTDARLRDTSLDGRSEDIDRSAGTTEWVPQRQHAGENLGDSSVEFLAIVPKN